MSQVLTLSIRIHPEGPGHLQQQSQVYIDTVNQIVSSAVTKGTFPKLTTKNVEADLPSAILNQAIRDAKSVFAKWTKEKKLSILKKPVYYVNNQNYTLKEEVIAFPVWLNGKSQRITCKADITDRHRTLLKCAKLGLLRVVHKSNKWYVQVSLTLPTEPPLTEEHRMGVDLGLKVPAVAVTDESVTRFFGNGRENKVKKRKFRAKRKELGKAKKLNALRKLNNKEQRWMTDKDHKVSRQIVNFAIAHHISVIRLEKLTNIRKTARTSRKNEKNLHTWSFYRLAHFIAYKANLVGIRVEYVNPAYTSQICPSCGRKNKAKDRRYQCGCGFTKHRDIIGAMNIRIAPVADGHSLSA